MGLLLRKIDSNLWETHDLQPFPAGNFPGRVFVELARKNNDVSMWRWDESQATKERIVAAYICLTGALRPFSYRCVDEDALLRAGVSIIASEAETPDGDVNALHVDAKNVTGSQLYEVARQLFEAVATQEDIENDDILEFIARSRDAGYIRGRRIPAEISKMLA